MKKKKTITKKKVWRVIIIVFLLFMLSQVVMTKIIYDAVFPRYDAADWEISSDLEELIEMRELVSFESGSNLLQGYSYCSPLEESNAIVVVAPGFHAGADDYLNQIDCFLDYGYDVFAFDSTGCCSSQGKSSVGFSQELWDLDAALHYIEETYSYEETFLFGHSRGGYSVCGILEDEHEITAVASVSGLNSAMEAVISLSSRYVGNLAYGNYPLLLCYQMLLFDPKTALLNAADVINGSDVPVLIVQGTADTTAPMDKFSIYSHKDEIKSGNVTYYMCDMFGQNGHTDLMYDEDGTANDVLMRDICLFYQESMLQK